MLSSMTGFGRSEHASAGWSWVWEIRSVNGRGLELRWRLPPGLDALEPSLREAAAKSLRRGSVQATLTLRSASTHSAVINEELLEQLLTTALAVAARVPGAPVPRVESLLALPGVIANGKADGSEISEDQAAALKAGFVEALGALTGSRRAEGGRLGAILLGLLRQIDDLRSAAEAAARVQADQYWERLMASVSALSASVPGLPEERIAQEVALLAAKTDVKEELDRLASHVEETRKLLAAGGAVGRMLDFLVQELMREANTVCSKSASRELTLEGIQLKGVLEQLREQVQNLE